MSVVVAYGAPTRIARSAVTTAREAGHQGRSDPSHHAVALPDKTRSARGRQRQRASSCVEMSMGQMVDDVRLAVRLPYARCTSTAAPAV